MQKCSVSIFLLINSLVLSAQVSEGILLSNWKVDTLQASKQYNNTYNEVWGLYVNDLEYAIIGSTEGTHFVNITNPEAPIEDFFVRGGSYGDHIIHRDYHDYNGYLYALSDEDTGALKSTLQIIDISNLPESIEVVYDSRDRIRKAHNMFIDTANAILYACAVKGGDDPYAPLRVYDLSNPVEPTLIESFEHNIGGISVGHIHDAFVIDNIAYLNAGFDGLLIADFTDPANPEILTHLLGSDYAESGYNHSGWISEDGNYYYLADETWGTPLKVFDVSDPGNILYLGSFDAGNDSEFSFPHNPIAYCNFLFVSYYYDGLQVFDISDRENPERILQYATTDLTPMINYEGAWGVYPFLPSGNILVSDMQNGLFVIEGIGPYCTPSNIEDFPSTRSNIQIFPNPNNGFFSVESEEIIDHFRIVNLNGQVLFESEFFHSKSINIKNLNSGIYFGQFFQKDKITTKKIYIEN